MTKSKFDKYIFYETPASVKLPWLRSKSGGIPDSTESTESKITPIMHLDGDVIDGAFYSECAWLWPGSGSEQANGEKQLRGKSQVQPFDEVIAFLGTNPDNTKELGGEIDLWLEDEKHELTRSFVAYIPAGMKYYPDIKKVNKPIFHLTLGRTKKPE